ncbi:MAG TPA: TetR family transcriptional regulator [Acidimicrobiales bacterium]|nr:TetR family transcriptional regulator [Acidimicrobiales bacterium]
MGDPKGPSLRERNKARARAEIADAALRLFYDRGFEGVTVDEIVGAAGVSRRTFFRYFETKEDALLSDYPELNDRLTAALADSEGNEPGQDTIEAIRTGMHQMADWYIERSDVVLARSKVIRDTAISLGARNLEFLTQWERAVANAIGSQIGADPAELLPRTAAAIVVAAFRAALTQWVRSSCGADLHALIDQALDLIEQGLQASLSKPADPDRPPRPARAGV